MTIAARRLTVSIHCSMTLMSRFNPEAALTRHPRSQPRNSHKRTDGDDSDSSRGTADDNGQPMINKRGPVVFRRPEDSNNIEAEAEKLRRKLSYERSQLHRRDLGGTTSTSEALVVYASIETTEEPACGPPSRAARSAVSRPAGSATSVSTADGSPNRGLSWSSRGT